MHKSFNTLTVEEFIEHCEDLAWSPHSLRAYRGDLMGCLSSIGNQNDPAEFRKAACAWLNRGRLTWAPRTTKRKLASLSAMAEFLGEEGLFDGYNAPTPERLVAHPLPGGLVDLKAMFDAAGDNAEHRALLALCGLCGLRISEALNVTVRDFDEDVRTLHVRGGKGAKDRVLPVSGTARGHLIPLLKLIDYGKLFGFTDNTARNIFAALGEAAGISRKVVPHDLRSTALTAMYRATKDLRVVQEFAGHASSTTTEGYTKVDLEDLRNAADLVVI
jgi:integrase